MKRGVAAEYADADALVAAARAVRGHGYAAIGAYTPVHVRELDEVLEAPRPRLAIAAGVGAVVGAVAAYALQWWMEAYLYPVVSGGRPGHMPLPFLLITIEMGFLLGALGIVGAFMVAARLLTLWDPIFDVGGIESATRAGFWLAVSADDPRWQREELDELLRATGARAVHPFGRLS
ncbi:MAG TPA: DUF3341 domain-containing protein [Kofleriaceae bacterium]|nr:DUF3341 domain-containing protein [Kofleriaceae bacterium]